MTVTAGLDVGGAHLKVALVEDGRTVAVRQIACPLWQGMDKLDAALGEAAPLLSRATRHAVTMTGELSDLFPDRPTGVKALVKKLTDRLSADLRLWKGRRRFGHWTESELPYTDIASTNFLATATFVAESGQQLYLGEQPGDVLLIDMGSTTTDIVNVSVESGALFHINGLTDAERLASGSLVYTGLTRTSVMAVADRVPLEGRWIPLCREHYANMADVRRVLFDLPDGVDIHATADGRGKSQEESIARLARMLGRDHIDAEYHQWQKVARHIVEEQVRSIEDGCRQVMSNGNNMHKVKVVAAGIGADVVATIAARLGYPCIPFGDLVNPADEDTRLWATRCAPAVAVAQLANVG